MAPPIPQKPAQPVKLDLNGNKIYSGIEKAAIMMLSLPEDQAQVIFKKLDPDEIRELSVAMINLGSIKAETVEALCVEFVNEIASSGSLVGSLDSTERLLGRVLSKEEAANLLEDIAGPAGKTIWDKLSNVNEEVLAKYLKNEYPQTIAVILSKIKARSAASIIAMFPDDLAKDVLFRMIKIENVRKEVLDDIEHTLRKEFMSTITRSSKKDPYEIVAEVFNNFDRSTEIKLIKKIEEHNMETADRIKSLMFTFEDVAALTDNLIQMIMKNIDRNKLALALKGVNEETRNKFTRNMSDRAAKILLDDMKTMGAVRLKDVELAQNLIVNVTKDMADRGEINITKVSDSEDLLVS